MLIVTISEKGAPPTGTNFDKTEVTIGRVKGNDIVLPKTNVSKRHARIVIKDGKTILIDLKSTNGTYVNGRKITTPQVITEADKVFIGDFTLEVKDTQPAAEARPVAAPLVPLPSFGAAGPSAVSLPSVGGMEGGLGDALGPVGHGLDSVAGPSHAGMGAVSSPHGQMPGLGSGPAGPGFTAQAPAVSKPSFSGPGVTGPGQNLGSAPSLLGHGTSAPAPISAPSLGGPSPISAPSLGAPAAAGPVLGAGSSSAPLPGSAPSLGASVSSPSMASAPAARVPEGGPSVGGASLSASRPSGVGVGTGAATEGVLDKSLRLPTAAQEKSKQGASVLGQGSPVHGSSSPSLERELYAASLPEDVYVEDARSREGDLKIEAARILMETYLNEQGLDNLMQQVYPPPTQVQDSCYESLSACLDKVRGEIPSSVNVDELLDFCLKEAAFLGAMEYLLDDESVTDFTIYRPDMLIVEREGHREVSDYQYTSASSLYLSAQRLLALQGMNAQTAPSFSEVRLGDGTQIQVMLPPAAVASATICVRKVRRSFSTLNELVRDGFLSAEMEKFLLMCIKSKRNILIVGSQGSGRTSLLNALASEIVDGERIATIESSAMLMLPQVSVMSFEAQPASYAHGSDMASLIRQSSRMRGERLIVDALSTSADVCAFVHAVSGGLQGSMASIAALRSIDGVERILRLYSLDSSSGRGLETQIAGLIDIVVCLRNYSENKKRAVEISELVPHSGSYRLNRLFEYVDAGMGERGAGAGRFRACGQVAHFYKELELGGVSLDSTIFSA